MSPTTEGRLPPEENRRIFREQIAPVYLDGCTPQQAPVVVIVAGQTGAGKTAVTRMVKDTLERSGEVAWINMDFYNPHHPDYARWQAERPQEADALVRPDGDAWWEQAQQYALERGFHILLESAMVTPDEYENICRRIQSAPLPPGVAPYRIETAFVAVPGPISRLGIMSRYLEELQEHGHGRLVDPAIHDAALAGVVRGAAAFEAEGLGDYAAVLRRDGSTVHSQPIAAGQGTPEDQLTLVAAIRSEHARVQSPAEAAQFAARHAAATLIAPDFAMPELQYVAQAAAPLLPPPTAPWREASARAAQLRGTAPAGPDPRLAAHTDADVVQLLAHTLADRHAALSAGTAQTAGRQEAATERLLGELARRATLTPDQRAQEQQQRQVLRTAAHRAVSEPGSALPARPTAAAARSRSTTVTRSPGDSPTMRPGPAAVPRPGRNPEQGRGRGRAGTQEARAFTVRRNGFAPCVIGMDAGLPEVLKMTDVVLRLSARDLVHADLASCGWAGSEHHLAGVAKQLERARTGEVDYLAVCPATDIPVAKGGVDYQVKQGVGTLWQLAVHPALQSCGIGTFLVEAAELRIRNRGLRQAELGVEEGNPRARALYERLGYVAYDRQPDSWDEQAPDGSLRRYETMCTLMRKELT